MKWLVIHNQWKYVNNFITLFEQNTYACSIDPIHPTPIEDNTYDVMLCCAGFFQGLISPLGFKELIRITKPG